MLGSNAAYRLQELGSRELNWAAIGQRLGHTGIAAAKAYRRLVSPPVQVAQLEWL